MTALCPFSVHVVHPPCWTDVVAEIWQRAAEALPATTARVVLYAHSADTGLTEAGGPATPLPLLAAWLERCRERWPAAESFVCSARPLGRASWQFDPELAALAVRSHAHLVDLRQTERAVVRVAGSPLAVPLLWLLPGTLFLFAPLAVSARMGLQGARAALAASIAQPGPLPAPDDVLPRPALTVLDVRRVTAVVSSEQLVAVRPGALVVAGSAAEADALGQGTVVEAGLQLRGLLSLEPEHVAERWEAALTERAARLAHMGAALVRRPDIAALPRAIRRLQRGRR